jgi:autotransporter strand-loop-strand O-heptosyltransferase
MKKILIRIDVSIGDTIAAVPYVGKFSIDHSEEKILFEINDNLIPLLSPVYPTINFVGRNHNENYDEKIEFKYDYGVSVQSGFAKQLGYDNPEYIRPKIINLEFQRPIKNKYITIGIHSTSQLKYWNHPKGKRVQPESLYWNELCGMIRKEGYTPVVVEQYDTFGNAPYRNGLPNKSNKKFGQSLLESMNLIYHSEFYIGLSSGMAWIAHAMGKPVAIIANFTEEWNEFDLSTSDYIKITNKNVCHGCWNKINVDHTFDKDDWYWCPKHKGTERQFECHTSITPEMVLENIKHWL